MIFINNFTISIMLVYLIVNNFTRKIKYIDLTYSNIQNVYDDVAHLIFISYNWENIIHFYLHYTPISSFDFNMM